MAAIADSMVAVAVVVEVAFVEAAVVAADSGETSTATVAALLTAHHLVLVVVSIAEMEVTVASAAVVGMVDATMAVALADAMGVIVASAVVITDALAATWSPSASVATDVTTGAMTDEMIDAMTDVTTGVTTTVGTLTAVTAAGSAATMMVTATRVRCHVTERLPVIGGLPGIFVSFHHLSSHCARVRRRLRKLDKSNLAHHKTTSSQAPGT